MKFGSIILFILLIGFVTNAQSLYKTPSGKKYHLGKCYLVKNTSKKIRFSQIKHFGLSPCKRCKPPKTNTLAYSSRNKSHGKQKKLVRCQGKTKKGRRCKRKTRIGDGYCFQHQPG